MRKKVLALITIILIVILLKLIYNMSINNALIKKYKAGEYSESQAKALTFLNFHEKYVAHYNYGNILYQNGEYEKAIEEYKKAINGSVPKNKECNIRINYALAICKTVNVDEKDQESIKNAIETYENAIEVLKEKGCNVHNEKAKKLKEDIQKEIDRLKNLQNQEPNDDDDEEEKDEKNTQEKKMESIEERIQKIKEEATIEQRATEEQFTKYSKGYHTTDKNW